MKKPPGKVTAISGLHKSDRISQAELEELENLQRLQWTVDKRAALKSEEIKTRLLHGAVVDDGPLYFDANLEMVRSHKKAEAK